MRSFEALMMARALSSAGDPKIAQRARELVVKLEAKVLADLEDGITDDTDD